ncbi:MULTISPECIES: hypothetical protein [unclassified Halomonas]|uniref:hypothetical protein n=1 Tax=unclassified Halomonas TaxID=2609666 RepID=UPI0028881D86|nr:MULTISPECIES: hypothetical protein [unclassified Halomonas]MDT0499737.1 hypothetical protein [Halomonas sp. PAR7]MDT0510446.1 hypothetical protein [Halomonas sp. LES1]MDT0589845.1 hypothetical protein [Halomonas sp. PAR8]
MTMSHATPYGRLKLAALLLFLSLPVLVATVMALWRIGIPEGRTAHGELAPGVPELAEWPLTTSMAPAVSGDWVLAFDCGERCKELSDQWWRLHRALGSDAPRVSRLRVGGVDDALPGAVVGQWAERPAWLEPGRLWVIDPRGQVVLGYEPEADPYAVKADLGRLLRMNPEAPWQAGQELAGH